VKELDDLLSQILGQQHEHAGETLDGPAWNDLVGSELDRIGLAEENGGAGGELADAVLVITRCAEAGLAAPLTETLLVAGACVSRSGQTLPAGRVSAVLPVARPLLTRPLPSLRASRTQGGWRLSGSAAAVAWGDDADWLVTPVSVTDSSVTDSSVTDSRVTDGGLAIAILARADYTVTAGTNQAGEPRDTVHLDGREVPADQLAPVVADALDDLVLRAALGRTAQLLGAIRACVSLTIGYVGLREQFGRPIGRQQAVRHAIAEMVGEAAATEAATTSAREQLAGAAVENSRLAVSIARVQAARAATSVSAIAHQLHGAIGLTQEYPLHHFTSRLWSWRDEYGSEHDWAAALGTAARDHDDLWSALTSLSRPQIA
jgi:acyl-CoA dehydrogenase